MVRSSARKTTPKVKDGRVQKKNRSDESEYLALVDGKAFTVIKHRAKPGIDTSCSSPRCTGSSS